MTVEACPTVRRRGRPARISREQIVDEALALLEQEGFEAFSMPRLGRRMDVSPMALYKHFTGREAILDAAARQIASQFAFHPLRQSWDEDLLRWFTALFDLFERYPVAIPLLKLEDISSAWLRIWAPLAMILSATGLSKGRLSFATSWLSSVAMGLVIVHNSRRSTGKKTLFAKSTGIEPVDAVLEEVDHYYDMFDKRRILDFGAVCAVESIRKHFVDGETMEIPESGRPRSLSSDRAD
jgi:AcrR family transcriptional regulator